MEEDEREVQWLRNWTPMAVDYGEYDPLRAGSIDGTGTTPHDRGIVRAMATQCEPKERGDQGASQILCRQAAKGTGK